MRNDTLQEKQRIQNDIANMLMQLQNEHNVAIYAIDLYPANDTIDVFIQSSVRCKYYQACNYKNPNAKTCATGGGGYCGMFRQFEHEYTGVICHE